MATFYLIRHGQRIDFEEIGYKQAERPWDYPLSKYGHRQAELTANSLKDKYFHDSAVGTLFVSPFIRCIETAVPIARRFNIPITIMKDLSELLLLEHADTDAPCILDCEELNRRFPDIVIKFPSPYLTKCHDYPKQTVEEYFHRTRSVFDEMKAICKEKGEAVIPSIVVGHGATLLSLILVSHGKHSNVDKAPIPGLRSCSVCSIYRLMEAGSPPRWVVDVNCDDEHLRKDPELASRLHIWPHRHGKEYDFLNWVE